MSDHGILVLKLVNSDELIGKYVNEDENNIYLNDIVQLQSIYDPDAKTSRIVMLPYTPFSNPNELGTGINKGHITYVNKFKDKFVKYYLKSLGLNENPEDFVCSEDFDLPTEQDEQFPTYNYINTSKTIH